MVQRFSVTIPALTGENERTAYVYLPQGYGETEKRYPVIYMFDGHNLFSDEEAAFGKCWGLENYLDDTRTQVIVAAVECNHRDHERLKEYTPESFTFKDGSFIKAKGKKYMDWLVKEFKPYIDENYLTLPQRENSAIAGSSMGGLMTLFALCKYGKYFSRGAALSPSLWVNGGATSNAFIEKAKFTNDVKIYLDYGSKEFSNRADRRETFANTCAALIKKGVNVTCRVVEGGTHSEASWERQIPYFMSALGFFPG